MWTTRCPRRSAHVRRCGRGCVHRKTTRGGFADRSPAVSESPRRTPSSGAEIHELSPGGMVFHRLTPRCGVAVTQSRSSSHCLPQTGRGSGQDGAVDNSVDEFDPLELLADLQREFAATIGGVDPAAPVPVRRVAGRRPGRTPRRCSSLGGGSGSATISCRELRGIGRDRARIGATRRVQPPVGESLTRSRGQSGQGRLLSAGRPAA